MNVSESDARSSSWAFYLYFIFYWAFMFLFYLRRTADVFLRA